jgi:hypothetical protein
VEGTDATFHFPFDHPTGIITYDRSGWMAVQIDVKGVRKPFVNGPASGTGEEKAAAFDNYLAYYGTYTLDLKAQTITHHLEDASPPNWRGVNNVRWFEFRGNDRLLLIPREDGKGGVIDRTRPVNPCRCQPRAAPVSRAYAETGVQLAGNS